MESGQALRESDMLEENPLATLYGSVLSVVQDYMADPELDIRKAAVRFVKEVSVGTLFCKVMTQQITFWSESDKQVERVRAITDMVALLYPSSALLDGILHFLEADSERIRQVAITCLSEHIHEKYPIATSHKFYSLTSNVKTFITQVVSDVMISDVRTPTLHMYSEDKELPETKTAAFQLLYQARFVSHEAVCNAVLSLESTSDVLVVASISYLVMVALISEEAGTRSPAVSALAGPNL
jgi:hypothetical protein